MSLADDLPRPLTGFRFGALGVEESAGRQVYSVATAGGSSTPLVTPVAIYGSGAIALLVFAFALAAAGGLAWAAPIGVIVLVLAALARFLSTTPPTGDGLVGSLTVLRGGEFVHILPRPGGTRVERGQLVGASTTVRRRGPRQPGYKLPGRRPRHASCSRGT